MRRSIKEMDKRLDERDEEIEKLNKQIEEYQKALDETTSEKINLENIIKEVREYIEEHYTVKKEENIYMTEDTKGLLEILNSFLKILDKENKDEQSK